jgi:hypothetical protein
MAMQKYRSISAVPAVLLSLGAVIPIFSPTAVLANTLPTSYPAPVPGYVAPITQAPIGAYIDDTRGLYLPEHVQLRAKTQAELAGWQQPEQTITAAQNSSALNRLATGEGDVGSALNRIANSDGLLARGAASGGMEGTTLAQNFVTPQGMGGSFAQPRRSAPDQLAEMPSLATGGQARVQAPTQAPMVMDAAGPQEIAVGNAMNSRALDLQNGIVRIKEERITVRRALQRMLDQVGGSGWVVVWDLDEVNVALPEMEISLYTEEPFMNVLNALLARLQSRSGQPLRVIKYDQTQRLVITDRSTAVDTGKGIGPGTEGKAKAAVTETVLKEGRVSLHYDEIPLVDALENMVNQAGGGEWRLRMYAGTDQVLKPAHIEEPFGVAIERVLKVFNLRYEIFPGGKLVVVTAGDAFGFRGVQ